MPNMREVSGVQQFVDELVQSCCPPKTPSRLMQWFNAVWHVSLNLPYGPLGNPFYTSIQQHQGVAQASAHHCRKGVMYRDVICDIYDPLSCFLSKSTDRDYDSFLIIMDSSHCSVGFALRYKPFYVMATFTLIFL